MRHDYLRVSDELAEAYGSSGAFQKGTDLARKTAATAETALRTAPRDAFAMDDLSAADAILADRLTDQQNYAGAIVLRERALDLARRVAEAKPANAEAERTLALAEKKLGALYGVSERYQECRQEYERAREIDERRAARNPTDMRAKLDLSYDYNDLGWVISRMGSYDDALASHRRALALRAEVAKADPNDQRAASAMASSTDRIGTVLHKKSDLNGSLAELQQAAALYEKIGGRPGADWASIRSLAEVHVDVAEALVDLGARRGASAAERLDLRNRAAGEYRKAVELYQGLQQRGVLPAAEVAHIGELQTEADKITHAAQ